MESITLKLQRQLRRHGYTDLPRMQDIGGCRAVMWPIDEVRRLVEELRQIFPENSPFHPRFDDYIAHPKPDGYRSIHIAIRYHSNSPAHAEWCGRRIEMQIRSTLQHAWATAVETVDLFENEKLKIGQASPKWSRFFALASNAFAKREQCPLIPGLPADCTDELRTLWKELRVPERLNGWIVGMQWIQPLREGMTYLLTVDVTEMKLRISAFDPDHTVQANEAYAAAEEEERANPHRKSVLASVETIEDLKKAFPNYYADTIEFLNNLRDELREWDALPTPSGIQT